MAFQRYYLLLLTVCFATASIIPTDDGLMSPTDNLAKMDANDLSDSLDDKVNEVDEWLGSQTRNCYESVLDKACPWIEVAEHDNNRVPRRVTKAVCQCEGCVDFSSGLMDPSLGSCEEVVKPTMVLRRQSSNHPYIVDMELVPYACVCKLSDTER